MENKKNFIIIGLIVSLAILLDVGLVYGLILLGRGHWGDEIPELYRYLVTFLVMDAVVLPVTCLLLSRLPGKLPERDSITPKDFFKFFAMIYGMAIASNIVTVLINQTVIEATGHGSISAVLDLLSSQSGSSKIVTYIFAVIVAPIMEELTFRRFLLTRLLPYGEKIAIVTSAVMFGLFHGNTSQALYAAVLGLGLGYMYVRTGNIRNNILLHMLINSVGTLTAGLLGVNMILGMVFSFGMVIFAFWGITVFILNKEDMYLEKRDGDLKAIEAWKNPGMAVFLITVIAEICYNFWAA